MSATNLLDSPEEEQLRQTLAHFLTARCDPMDALGRAQTDDPYDHALWRDMSQELGLAGLLVAEELGGQGGTARGAALVCEELGRAVAAVPFLGSAVVGAVVVRTCRGRAAADLLRALCSGATIAVALPWRTSPHATLQPSVMATPDGLTGSVSGVLDGGSADVLVVPAIREGNFVLCAVRRDGTGVRRRVVRGIDLTRGWIDLELDGASYEALSVADEAVDALRSGVLYGAAMLASEQVGVAQACLDQTVAYVSQRHQFARPIGSFQAIKHRLADVWLEILGARAAARYAADAIARDADDRAIAVAVAKAHCSEVAVHAAEESLQLHGGLGMTWEHLTHLYLKRAKLDELLFGAPGRHRSELAVLIDLPAAS